MLVNIKTNNLQEAKRESSGYSYREETEDDCNAVK